MIKSTLRNIKNYGRKRYGWLLRKAQDWEGWRQIVSLPKTYKKEKTQEKTRRCWDPSSNLLQFDWIQIEAKVMANLDIHLTNVSGPL